MQVDTSMASENQLIQDINVISYPNSSQNDVRLIFVHGAWHGAWVYDKYFLPYFNSKGFACYALDFRSHGKSKKKGIFRLITLNKYVQDLHTVVEELSKNSEKIILIGHSMGGEVVQKYLAKYPDKIHSAVLLGPGTTWGTRSITFRVMIHHPLTYMKMNLLLSLYPIVSDFKRFKKYLFYSETDEETLKSYQKLVQNESYTAYVQMMLTRIKYKKITMPVLVVGGEKDQIFFVKHLQKLTSKLPKGESAFFENTGHNLMLEKDWQKVANKIIDWIQV